MLNADRVMSLETVAQRLLRRMRATISSNSLSSDKLGQCVVSICEELGAQAVALYLLSKNDILELTDSYTILSSSPFQNEISLEGGDIGRSVRFSRDFLIPGSATQDPDFSADFAPALMGVPLVLNGRTFGILVVQGPETRAFLEDELETIQTVSMIIAPVADEEHKRLTQKPFAGSLDSQKSFEQPYLFDGVCVSSGTGYGRAVFHEPNSSKVAVLSDDPKRERTRLKRALDQMLTSINKLFMQHGVGEGKEYQDILEAYKLFAHDRGWRRRIMEAINTGLSAESAVQKVLSTMRRRLEKSSGDHWQERVYDLEDLSNRLIRHLNGGLASPLDGHDEEGIVVIANHMGPAELLDYDRERLNGLVLSEDSHTAHVAIVARSLAIPVLCGVSRVFEKVNRGDRILLDGDIGRLYIRPLKRVMNQFDTRSLIKNQHQKQEISDDPALTKDNQRISVFLNAGLRIDLKHLVGTDGVGLYRTEIPFMMRNKLPSVNEQTDLYRSILKLAGEKTVVFRTLDIGGDKILPYLPKSKGENPAMGWRAIRVCLDRPVLLRNQIRALLRAAEGRPVSVMFPMISEIHEFDQARELVETEVAREKALGHSTPRFIKYGAMLEVPALAFQLPTLLPKVDFISIGSNDLHQFFFAVDRGQPYLTDRFDNVSYAFLSFLRSVAEQCDVFGVPLTVCGEMAGKPLDALALIAVGIKRLSMAPGSISPVRKMVESVCLKELQDFFSGLQRYPLTSFRSIIKNYAVDHGIIY